MSAPLRSIALFDFDHTLILSDSLWPFLGYTAGWPRTIITMLKALGKYFLHRWNTPLLAHREDKRTFIKSYLLKNLLANIPLEKLQPVLANLYHWQKWNTSIKDALLDHHAQGHQIVIASGGLDLYLPHLLKDLPYDDLICTKIGITDGIINGEMTVGNCVRIRKAELVAEYLATHGPFLESWGYGNFPHDIPMLNLLKHRIIV